MAIGTSTITMNSSSAGALSSQGTRPGAMRRCEPADGEVTVASAARLMVNSMRELDARTRSAAIAADRHVLGAPGQAHRLALGGRCFTGVLADHRDETAGRVDLVQPVVALEDARRDAPADAARGRVDEADLLGPHRHAQLVPTG